MLLDRKVDWVEHRGLSQMLILLFVEYFSIRIALLATDPCEVFVSWRHEEATLEWSFPSKNSQLAVTLAYAEYTAFGQIANHVDLRRQ
jgi:hypothetical protein